ncbi:MAG: hypothetical protein K9K65_11620 [Desulfarculaceae bacterium]|nr:hypothetical protein [Desulfarculaceae bacterium]MCF8048894.1 hypothetical protein [Desulfarculaceae bacterium]MCF8064449.1 hypothetical protein [Desulfarculaceae bacterium]MCF8098482.1 hypothetical protein [Desulfarculaceae bacterium]MCF8122303.1 hypothetical protein [Desulfarculaceae bacterium]
MSIPLQIRSKPEDKLPRREVTLLAGRGVPASLDEEARTIEVVVATEQPVRIYDWERGVVDEVLLMSGLIPMPRQVPLLDTHNRWSTNDVLGSLRGFKREGEQVVATAHFSQTAEKAWTLAQEGHLTDVSVGYQVSRFVWVEEGKTAKLGDREFTGPVKVATKWEIREVSAVPIGADSKAKVRAQASNEPQEEGTMDKKTRTWLEARGLSKDATEAEAWAYLERMQLPEEPAEQPEPQPQAQRSPAGQEPGQGADQRAVEDLTLKVVRAEQGRLFEIRQMGRTFNLPEDQVDQMITDNLSVDQARAQVMDHLAKQGAQTQGGAGYRGPVEFGADETDKFRTVAQDAVMLRAGMSVDKPAEGALDGEIRGYTLSELARYCLRRSAPTARTPWDSREMVGRALTTSDLPFILGNIANKSLLAGWESAPETWRTWVGTGSVNDFKIHTAAGLGENGDLDEIKEEGEYNYDKAVEVFEQYAIAVYGKLFKISRQAIINDDLGALTRIPAGRGEAAARKVGDVIYAVLIANSAMGDGTALFATSHGNLLTGASLGTASLGEAFKAMALQKGPNNAATLNIQPQFLIAPVALKSDHEMFFNTTQIGNADTGTIYQNPYAGNVLTRIYEPRLDASDAAAWYLAADKGKTIVAYFLNGVQSPYTESRDGWNTDGIEYKVRIDVGAKAMDWRRMALNPGPTG